MGLNKTIRTAQQLGAFAWFTPEDRAAARIVLEREQTSRACAIEQHKQDRAKGEATVAYFPTQSFGNTPTVDGNYLVVDGDTGSVQHAAYAGMRVRESLTGQTMLLNAFNQRAYRWFLVGNVQLPAKGKL